MLTESSVRRVLMNAMVGVVVWSGAAAAQQRLLTIDDIYDPATRVNFSGTSAREISWIDGSHYARTRPSGGGVAWIAVDSVNGNERPIFDADRMAEALARLPGLPENEARRAARSRSLMFDGQYAVAL